MEFLGKCSSSGGRYMVQVSLRNTFADLVSRKQQLKMSTLLNSVVFIMGLTKYF